MQNSMVLCIFSVFDWKQPFQAKLVRKVKNAGFNGDIHFFCFRLGLPFLGKFGLKSQNCLLKVNLLLRIIRICRFQWWYSFFFLRQETPFLDKFGPKNQSCQFKLKFCTKTKSNMQNSMVVFSFSVLDGKQLFYANLVQNIKIISLS